MPDPLSGAEFEELDALEEFTKVRGFKFFRKILNEHRIHLLSKAHQALEKHQDRTAGEYLAQSKESQRILDLIRNRKTELQSKQMKGEQQ